MSLKKSFHRMKHEIPSRRRSTYHGCIGNSVVQLVVVKVVDLLLLVLCEAFPLESLLAFGDKVEEIVLSSGTFFSFFERDFFAGFATIGGSSSSSKNSCLISSSSSSSRKSGSFSGVVMPNFFSRIFSAHSNVPCFGRFKFRC